MLNWLIRVGSLLVVILGVIIGWPFISARLNLSDTKPGSVRIQSELPRGLTDEVSAFAQKTVNLSVIPSQLTLTKVASGTREKGDVYIGTWNRDGKLFSLLVGLTSDNKAINYQRIWSMPPAASLTASAAAAALSDIFLPDYLAQFSPVTCSSTAQAPKETITECGGLKTSAGGDLYGITVRSPVALEAPPEISPRPTGEAPPVTIVSACFIPKEGAPVYTAPLCI